MPVLRELSQIARAQLATTDRNHIPGAETPIADDFEAWLSYLLDDVPWLDAGAKYRSLGAFHDLVEAIHVVLEAAEATVATRAMPGWLEQLVRHWENENAQVITFNYDTLVEMAWLESHPQWNYPLPLYPVPLTLPLNQRVERVKPEGVGLRLLKLHGSLSWWYSGEGSPPGDVVYAAHVPQWSRFQDEYGYDRQHLSDKFPLIVAPTAIKSSYYTNGVIRALWRKAAEAVHQADRLVLMGFSMPPSDLTFGALLATELREGTEIVPVNLTEEVAGHLTARLGSRFAVARDFLKEDAIEAWVTEHARGG